MIEEQTTVDRPHARIKLAAATLAPKDVREAAIIGGLVHCLVASVTVGPCPPLSWPASSPATTRRTRQSKLDDRPTR